jgi:hypothetical protein
VPFSPISSILHPNQLYLHIKMSAIISQSSFGIRDLAEKDLVAVPPQGLDPILLQMLVVVISASTMPLHRSTPIGGVP